LSGRWGAAISRSRWIHSSTARVASIKVDTRLLSANTRRDLPERTVSRDVACVGSVLFLIVSGDKFIECTPHGRRDSIRGKLRNPLRPVLGRRIPGSLLQPLGQVFKHMAKSLIEIRTRLAPRFDRSGNRVAILLRGSFISVLCQQNRMVNLPQLQMWEDRHRCARVRRQRDSKFVDFAQNDRVQIPPELHFRSMIRPKQTEIGCRLFGSAEQSTCTAKRRLPCKDKAKEQLTRARRTISKRDLPNMSSRRPAITGQQTPQG